MNIQNVSQLQQLLFNCTETSRSSGDLVGLKVSHDFGDMDDGDARILTLKDSRILDNEGTDESSLLTSYPTLIVFLTEDELQNVEMAEEDRHKKNMELKIKKRDYTGYDDDEFVEGNLMKRSILSKYDEELEGPRQTVRCSHYTVR